MLYTLFLVARKEQVALISVREILFDENNAGSSPQKSISLDEKSDINILAVRIPPKKTHFVAHPPAEPPSRQRKGALSQLQPELVQEVTVQGETLFVEACMGVVSAAAASGGNVRCGGGEGGFGIGSWSDGTRGRYIPS